MDVEDGVGAVDNGGGGGGSKVDAAAAADEAAAAAGGKSEPVCVEASSKWAGGRRQLQLSTDVSWQLVKDADGPDGKMKKTRKFGFLEYGRRTRK